MTAATKPVLPLKGVSVLVVEDNFLNGLALQQTLQGLGCEVIGPVASVSRGLEIIAHEEIDIGVLDINIIGGTVTPIAEQLQQMHRQFLFVSGYASPRNLPDSLQNVPRLSKPVGKNMLEQALLRLLLNRSDEDDDIAPEHVRTDEPFTG